MAVVAPPKVEVAEKHEPDHEIRIMDRAHGDIRIEWEAGNADSESVARKTFDEAKKKGMKMFSIDAKGRREGEEIKTFDPSAERIVGIPQIVGG